MKDGALAFFPSHEVLTSSQYISGIHSHRWCSQNHKQAGMWWGRGWPPPGTSCKCCSSPATYTRECPAFLLILKLGYPGLCLTGSTVPSGSPSSYTLKLLWLLLLIVLWLHWQMLVLPVSLLLLLVITVSSSCIFLCQALNLNLTWMFLFVCLIFRKQVDRFCYYPYLQMREIWA